MRSTPLDVPPAVLRVLQSWIDDPSTSAVLRLRARIVVLSAQGVGPSVVAAQVGCSAQTAASWRERFRSSGIDGLRDAPRSGRPVSVDPAMIIRATVAPREPGAARWSSRTLGDHLGVSNVTVANVWRAWGMRPGTANPVDLQTEPVLDRTPREVLGLHVDPSVRVVAMRVRDRGEPRGLPGGRRIGIGGHLTRVLDAAGTEDVGGHALDAFLGELDVLATGAVTTNAVTPVRLIVDGAAEPIEKWAVDRELVGLHVVPSELSWDRIVRVACVLAGVTGDHGPASLEALRAAIDRHPGGRPFSWTAV